MSDSNLQTGWLAKMIPLYQEGRSDVEVCKELGITLKYFEGLYTSHPKFKELVDRGRDYAQAWWYEQGRKNLDNKSFMTELWKFNMANRHGWATKNDTKNLTPEAVNLDKVREEFKTILPELAALAGQPLDQRKIVSESAKSKRH